MLISTLAAITIDTPLADWIYFAIVAGAAAGALAAAALMDAMRGEERMRERECDDVNA